MRNRTKSQLIEELESLRKQVVELRALESGRKQTETEIRSRMSALDEAHKRAARAEKEWIKTFNAITDFVSIHDKDFNILKANKATRDRFGITENDLKEKKCYEIFHGTDTHWPDCPLVKSKESLKPATEEVGDPHMGGVFQIDTFPLFDEKGEFTAVIHISKDITEKKKLQEELDAKNKELEWFAARDGLTGLFNRRRFYEQLNYTIATAKRYDHALSLLFFDLDNFKRHNDVYGHLEGDRVLREVAECAQRIVRNDVDFCCRYGGEEFAVILPETAEKGAFNVAERLRKEVEIMEFYPNTGEGAPKPVRITVSVDVAMFKDYDADTFVGKADKAMYEAKKLGKNTVIIYA